MATLKNGHKATVQTTAPSLPSDMDIQLAPATGNAAPDFCTENLPNAGKLIGSLRHLGYDNMAAIKDICDNCKDADASQIEIFVEPTDSGVGRYEIIIVDNGTGMNWETLNEALKLGSDTTRNEVSDLGKFGMGLVTASLSICRRVEVITKEKNGPILYSVQDVDEIVDRNRFVKILTEAGDEQVEQFEESLNDPSHGTIVVLSKCDHLQNKDWKTFSNKLRKELGQAFRYFLWSGKTTMLVNGELVKPIDPMIRDGDSFYPEIKSEEFSRERYDIEFEDENGNAVKEQVEVALYVLPDFGIQGNKERGINWRNQGFYLLRNYREIAAGESFKLFTTHPYLNRFRGEIFVSGTLDEPVGVDFTKQKPKFKQSLEHKLKQKLEPQIDAINAQLKAKKVKADDKENASSHEEAARQIGQKAHLLAKPKLGGQKTTVGDGSGAPRSSSTKTSQKPAPMLKGKKEVELPCKFETASMTAAGPIWDAVPRGNTLEITWNVDHAFYQRFVLDNQDNPSMVTAADFLVYSLCAAELTYSEDDDEDGYEIRRRVLENIRSILSGNLRTLLA